MLSIVSAIYHTKAAYRSRLESCRNRKQQVASARVKIRAKKQVIEGGAVKGRVAGLHTSAQLNTLFHEIEICRARAGEDGRFVALTTGQSQRDMSPSLWRMDELSGRTGKYRFTIWTSPQGLLPFVCGGVLPGVPCGQRGPWQFDKRHGKVAPKRKLNTGHIKDESLSVLQI